MDKPKILIVDDEEGIRNQLKWALSSEYNVLLAENAQSALKLASLEKPNIVALDLILSPDSGDDEEGLKVLQEIVEIDPKVKVIMITGNDDRDKALKAIELGAYDYYFKPINMPELQVILKRALHIQSLEKENERLQQAIQEQSKFEQMLGNCPQMQEVFSVISRVATTNATVLIYGETGTGKELVARAIHERSLRKSQPFVPINCGAIPETLLESELFGHEKGAFTDAHIQRKGKLELADKGTVFLDEIGELSLSLQVKILRFLQDRVIERVGGRQPIELDVRIIAATNKDLQEAINQGAFREDLYYRLSVVSIFLPPIRERGEDLLLLANYFLNKFARENKKKIKGFTPEAIESIKEYPWPGNVRELENRLHRAVLMTTNRFISPQDLGLRLPGAPEIKSLKEAKEQFELRFIKEALARNRGNISRAAKELNLSRVALYALMNKYRIKSHQVK